MTDTNNANDVRYPFQNLSLIHRAFDAYANQQVKLWMKALSNLDSLSIQRALDIEEGLKKDGFDVRTGEEYLGFRVTLPTMPGEEWSHAITYSRPAPSNKGLQELVDATEDSEERSWITNQWDKLLNTVNHGPLQDIPPLMEEFSQKGLVFVPNPQSERVSINSTKEKIWVRRERLAEMGLRETKVLQYDFI